MERIEGENLQTYPSHFDRAMNRNPGDFRSRGGVLSVVQRLAVVLLRLGLLGPMPVLLVITVTSGLLTFRGPFALLP